MNLRNLAKLIILLTIVAVLTSIGLEIRETFKNIGDLYLCIIIIFLILIDYKKIFKK